MNRMAMYRMDRPTVVLVCLWLLSGFTGHAGFSRLAGQDTSSTASPGYFQIQVVDSETGRGVPLVELKSVNGICWHTDSAGNIALNEPALMNQEVFFHLASHGYVYPTDGFGFQGIRLTPVPGKKAVIRIKRVNLARRIYRITGAGIYRDTRLLNLEVPFPVPELNAQVVGCDSVVNVLYKDRLYWFWGDTNRAGYPLGNFQVTGATSAQPASISPAKGILLEYFTSPSGFAKSMAPIPGDGPTWIFGAFVTRDEQGRERMIAKYEKIRPPLEAYQRGLVVFNDDKQQFEKLVEFDFKAPLYPDGQAFSHRQDEIDYVYFAQPFPLSRVVNDWQTILKPEEYEAYTYFKGGTSLTKEQGRLAVTDDAIERDTEGKLVCRWRKNAQPLSPRLERQLVQQGIIRESEAISLIVPARSLTPGNGEPETENSGRPRSITLAGGSVAWNAYRKKWILIAVEVFGTSMLGEIWFAESDQLEGPWENATKIMTHDRYSFYNPRHHPYFDQQKGRLIYLEGTYTTMFSGNPTATPRYDYNQIMYELDLADIPAKE